jgi:hypothetical protein
LFGADGFDKGSYSYASKNTQLRCKCFARLPIDIRNLVREQVCVRHALPAFDSAREELLLETGNHVAVLVVVPVFGGLRLPTKADGSAAVALDDVELG